MLEFLGMHANWQPLSLCNTFFTHLMCTCITCNHEKPWLIEDDYEYTDSDSNAPIRKQKCSSDCMQN